MELCKNLDLKRNPAGRTTKYLPASFPYISGMARWRGGKVSFVPNSANQADFQVVRFVSDSGLLVERQVRRIMPAAFTISTARRSSHVGFRDNRLVVTWTPG
jgi:hypothetical protein